MGYRVAVVGATGAVGQEMIKTLEQRKFPVAELIPLASAKSANKSVTFNGKTYPVKELTTDSFKGVQLALFSAGGSVSEQFAPIAAEAGAIVVDNTSAFRMEQDIPLVVPEVNAAAAKAVKKGTPRGIIANPNCSTIQMVVALYPLHQKAKLRRVVTSSYQSVAGAGQKGISELVSQIDAWTNANKSNDVQLTPSTFPYPILFECIPQIGSFDQEGNSVEELKMENETRKILGLPDLRVTVTTVRVPVLVGHSEAVNVEFENALSPDEARAILQKSPGIEVVDDPKHNKYPLARLAAGRDPVYVGRIRQDRSVPHGLNMWVVADNLRKGAALNAVQIAEYLAAEQILQS